MPDEALFMQLVNAADKLVAVVDNFEAIHEPPAPWEDMVQRPKQELAAVLAQCPRADGTARLDMRQEDLLEESFYAPGQSMTRENPLGVKLTHKPTGYSAEAYTHRSREDNLESAKAALEGMLLRKASR